MSRRGVIGLLAAVVASSSLGACGAGGSASYRFQMTVEVETRQGPNTGSAVYEVSARKHVALTSEEAERSAGVRGEALVVDLPDGPLFVLLKTPGGGSRHGDLTQMSMAALDKNYTNDWVQSAGRIAGSWSTKRGEVARADWPMMVRFRDIHDPTTVERVDPEAVGVKRIAVETTSDPVTTGIEKRLQWLLRIKGGYLHGGFTSRDAPLGLDGTAFSTEIKK